MQKEYFNTAVESIFLNYTHQEKEKILKSIEDKNLYNKIVSKIDNFRGRLFCCNVLITNQKVLFN